MRIANIQNGDSCPNGWKQILSPAKACRANSDAVGCYSVSFSSNKLSYQHICGKMVGYQKGTTNGYYALLYTTYPSKAIDGPYVDGVSLTYGTPCKHLLTYACGFSSDRSITFPNCPVQGILEIILPILCKIIIIVNLEVLIVQHMAQFILATHCGMERDAVLVTVVVHRLAFHGSIEMS